jgi:hypothetical protein
LYTYTNDSARTTIINICQKRDSLVRRKWPYVDGATLFCRLPNCRPSERRPPNC